MVGQVINFPNRAIYLAKGSPIQVGGGGHAGRVGSQGNGDGSHGGIGFGKKGDVSPQGGESALPQAG